MKKHGFTLIEVMVVIVIMGVLAAVAVPKLFGNVAKAKVSEVSVAAGAYIKLQDVFLAEKTALGNWSAIGYIAPGNGKTNNFCYNQGTMTENTTVVEQQSESLIGWAASNVASLNDCQANGWWSLAIAVEGSNNAIYSHNASSEGCAALTTGWSVGTTMTGNCASTSVNEVKTETPKEDSQPTAGTQTGNESNSGGTPQAGDNTQGNTGSQATTDEQVKQQEQTKSAVQAAKEAFTSCNHCSKEEKDKLKKAWDDEKEKCKQLYGNAVCE